jgi:hypothetical protein
MSIETLLWSHLYIGYSDDIVSIYIWQKQLRVMLKAQQCSIAIQEFLLGILPNDSSVT